MQASNQSSLFSINELIIKYSKLKKKKGNTLLKEKQNQRTNEEKLSTNPIPLLINIKDKRKTKNK